MRQSLMSLFDQCGNETAVAAVYGLRQFIYFRVPTTPQHAETGTQPLSIYLLGPEKARNVTSGGRDDPTYRENEEYRTAPAQP